MTVDSSIGLYPVINYLLAMSKVRFIERQANVRESAARLAEAVAQPENDFMRDATIQRFEFTFEVV